MIVFYATAYRFKVPSICETDYVNVTVFGLVSMVVGSYTSINRTSSILLQYKMRHMTGFDQLTGIKNRYSFEMQIDRMMRDKYGCHFCVYIDANGLHELNNTRGHEAGDEMLRCIAQELKRQFDETLCYRIGGDEFVVMGSEMTAEEI